MPPTCFAHLQSMVVERKREEDWVDYDKFLLDTKIF